MREDLAQGLYRDFPEITGEILFAVEDGWEPLLRRTFQEITLERNKLLSSCMLEKKSMGEDIKLFQVKEKFGTLRVYLTTGNEVTWNLCECAQWASASICEHCGTTQEVTLGGSWLKTLCKGCRKEWNRKLSQSGV